MKKYLTQKILKKFEPKLVFFVGKHGKSMTAHAIKTLFTDRGLFVEHIDVAKDIQSAISSLQPKFSFIKALKNALFASKYPEMLLLELHGEVSIPEQAFVIETFGAKKQNYPEGVTVLNKENSSINAEYTDFITTDEESYSIDKRIQGIFSKVQSGGNSLPLQIHGGIGIQHVEAQMLALEFANKLGINLLEAMNGLRKTQLLPGRMKLVPGIKKSLLIDDTYNSDPQSLSVALEEIVKTPLHEGKRKILVLGEMKGLGSDTETAHCKVGKQIAESGFDFVVAVGEKMYDLLECAKSEGMEESKLHHFTDVAEAGKFVQHEMHSDELVFIKGAKEDKLERVVKELMAFPLQAKDELLQR